MRRHIIIILLLMLGLATSTTAQKPDLPLSAFIKDESGMFEKLHWTSSQNRCKMLYNKHDILVLFFYTSQDDLRFEHDKNALHKYREKCLSEWNYLKDSEYLPQSMITYAGNMLDMENAQYSWNGYGDFYNDVWLNNFDLVQKTINTWTSWHAPMVPGKLVDVMECLYENKPLLKYGESMEDCISKAVNTGNHKTIDISGLLKDHEIEIIDEASKSINTNVMRNISVAIFFAPTFSRRNLQGIARQICEKLDDKNPELLLINEYNCDFAYYSETPLNEISDSKYEEMKQKLVEASENTFLDHDDIINLMNEYANATMTTSMRWNAFLVDGTLFGMCCFIPIALILGLIVRFVIDEIRKKKNGNQVSGASQYVVVKKIIQ